MPRACNTLSQLRTNFVWSSSFGLSRRFIPGDRRSCGTLPSKQAVAGSSPVSRSSRMNRLYAGPSPAASEQPGGERPGNGAVFSYAKRRVATSCLAKLHCLTKNLLLDSSPNHLHLKWFLTLQQDHLLAYVPLQYVRKLLVCLH